MSKSICITGLFWVAVALTISACEKEAPPPPVQMQPIAPPVQQVPVPAPVAVPAPPPATPLIPIEDEAGNTVGGGTGKVGGEGGGIDAPIGGKQIEGTELMGNYSCTFDAKGLPLGPFKLPPFGCRIFRAGDRSLKLGSSSSGTSNISGSIQNPTDKGFFIVGEFSFPGNKLNIKARMAKQPGDKVKYSGRGRSALNESNETKINYTLTMVKI